MMQPAVKMAAVFYTYPDGQAALQGVDLHVEEGERVALLGPNGAGKTTLALHLNGIYRPHSGTVHIDGLAVEDPNLLEIRRRVGMVFQDSNDQLFMPTVWEDTAFGPANLGMSGQELEQQVGQALDATGVSGSAHRAPHHLSGGEKQRAALATVLAMRPTLLVLDEPASGLDPAGKRDLINILNSLEMTMLVITHDLPLAMEVCGRSLLMDQGQVVADLPIAQMLADSELLARHKLEMPYYCSRATGR